MNITISQDPKELGISAGTVAGQLIRDTLAQKETANIILATGASQFETLNQLISEKGIDWSRVVMFHLDEYIGIPVTHPASFRKYLQERFLQNVPRLKAVCLINADHDTLAECKRIGNMIRDYPVDVALAGIGENGHLAFNDPPADFETDEPYIIVNLDEACRKQQWGEGWFKTLEEVPVQAISMSIKQIMKARSIICSVPDARKAIAVRNSLEQSVTNLHPASILQLHPDCRMYLDKSSASLLSPGIGMAGTV